MSSFSINSISQLNLSLNLDNKNNIENIQNIINDLKELIYILSFKISDISTTLQNEVEQQINQEFDKVIYDNTKLDGNTDTSALIMYI